MATDFHLKPSRATLCEFRVSHSGAAEDASLLELLGPLNPDD